MDKRFSKSLIAKSLGMLFLLGGCLPADMPSVSQGNNIGGGETPCTGSDCEGTEEPPIVVPPKVEIRHLIEPNLKNDPSYSTGVGMSGAGSYQKKITIPKTFGGKIYISGINMGTLQSRFVNVKFKFGYNEEEIILPAAVSPAPGITPNTNVSVLVVNLNTKPFRNVRLLYDLYDYNKYPMDADGIHLAGTAEPVQNNRHVGLYCRGLKLQHDPTFDGVGSCDQDSESCLYAYAKVVDQGLVEKKDETLIPLQPDFPQISSTQNLEYFKDSMFYKLRKPLPDTGSYNSSHVFSPFLFSSLGTNSEAVTISGFGEHIIAGRKFYYRGPYSLVNTNQWELKYGVNNLSGENKLFRTGAFAFYDSYTHGLLPGDTGLPVPQQKIYFNSYLFPIATKLNVGTGIEYLGSDEPQGSRGAESPLGSSGSTKWMDGSNARVQSINDDLEHIGSCNVVSTIEVLAKDKNGQEYIVARTNEVKLQLVRDTFIETETDQDILSSNFKVCSTNANCGGDDCCYNNRCWSSLIVSQCLDPNSSSGSKPNGSSCFSDLECDSLCCNQSIGKCSPHNTNKNPPDLCGKYEGQFCIAKEWCRKSPVRKCIIVKNGTTPTGEQRCRQHCYNVEEHGDCINGTCQAPYQEPIPPFNPNDPAECVNAVDPPSF